MALLRKHLVGLRPSRLRGQEISRAWWARGHWGFQAENSLDLTKKDLGSMSESRLVRRLVS